MKVLEREIEEVKKFTYLGADVTKNGGATADVKKRISLASGQFKQLSRQDGDISRKTKASLFSSLVLSVLLYGCEAWELTKVEEKRLDIFQTKCLRRIFKIRWQQHTPNNEILEMTGAEKISD